MLEITFNKQFFSHVFKNVRPWQTDQPRVGIATFKIISYFGTTSVYYLYLFTFDWTV